MRLIDADTLIDSLKKDWPQTSKITWAQIVAKCAPTIETEPAKHGEWEEKETYLNEGDCEITEWQSARCSKCGKYHTTPYMYSFDNFNFCPNCGAKMKRTGNDAE